MANRQNKWVWGKKWRIVRGEREKMKSHSRLNLNEDNSDSASNKQNPEDWNPNDTNSDHGWIISELLSLPNLLLFVNCPFFKATWNLLLSKQCFKSLFWIDVCLAVEELQWLGSLSFNLSLDQPVYKFMFSQRISYCECIVSWQKLKK